jgi:hypothetical protein
MVAIDRYEMTAHQRSGWIDLFRMCRAAALVALGATVHVHLPLAPADNPRVAPLRLASSRVEAAERGITINRALIFAPRSLPGEKPTAPPREEHRIPATDRLAGMQPMQSAHPLAARPLPRVAADSGTAVARDPAAMTTAPQPTLASKHLAGDLEAERSGVDDLIRLAVIPVAGPRRTSEEELVRQLIDRYTGALERLDVDAAQAAWPTVDGKALKRAFGQLASQRLTFKSCGITISGSTANARCLGSATYQPRIGSGPVQLASREWTFDFSKQDTDWRIVNTFVR